MVTTNWQQQPPVSIEDAARHANTGRSWRVRCVFVGANPENASGRSDKWWEASSPAQSAEAVVRWGATGTNGQSNVTTARGALAKAVEKVRKGYVLDTGGRAFAPPPKASFQDLVGRATWRGCTPDRALAIAGEHGFVALHVGLDATIPAKPLPLAVLPYLAADGSVWGLAPDGPTIYYARIRVAP
jgi:predicted DNA-binding WGR domain protein